MTSRSTLGLLAKLLAVLLSLSLVAAACGGDDSDEGADTDGDGTEESGDDDGGDDGGEAIDETGNEIEGEGEAVTEEEAQKGGTLRVGVEAETDGLNPTANNFAVSAYLMGYTVFEPLFYFDEERNWFPWLAESAEPVGGDFATWQVKLREGVTFHDGAVLNADAVIKHFERILEDPIISIAVRPAFVEENRFERIDEYTVQFNLKRPDTNYPATVSSQLGMIASPDWLDAVANDETLNQMPVGTGPFTIESRQQDLSTRFVRNDEYWGGTEDIHLDAIEFFIETDTALAAERLASGDLDVVVTSNADATLTLRDAGGVTTIENNLAGEDFAMVNTSQPPFDDIRARQALTFASDRQAYIDLIAQGTRTPADSMYHPDQEYNNPDVVQEANMPELAQPLVDEYCGEVPDQCTDGKINMELQFSGPSTLQTRIMDILSAGWEPFFNVTRQQLPQDQHITEVATGQWQVATWRQFGEGHPTLEVVWLACDSAEGLIALNWPRVCDEERDTALYAARAAEDEATRIAEMQKVQELVNAQYTYIFFTHANWTVGFQDGVKNICGNQGPPDPASGEQPTVLCNLQGRGFFHNTWLAQ